MTTRRRAFQRILGACAGAALLCALAPTAHADEREGTDPELPAFSPALLYSQLGHPDATPSGANDWSCDPSEEHPRPVVLLHGTWENRYADFARISPELKRDGYCVFAPNYGAHGINVVGLNPAVKGTGDIRESARELARFVDAVLLATGASQVDIVGHSQGGLMPRQYLKSEGGANPDDPSRNKVRNLVTLGATHHGTSLSGIATLTNLLGLTGFSPILLGDAAKQQAEGSEFIEELNAGGDTVPGVNYTVIGTWFDEITTPYDSTFLEAGPGARVRNVTLQDGCPIDLSDHLSMSYSPRAIGYVKQGLDAGSPAPPCVPHQPVL